MITYPSGTVLVKKVDGSNNFIEDALTSNDIELDVASGYVLYSNGDTITGSSLVTWDAENSAFKLGSNLKYTSSTFLVHSNTVDGSDNQYMGIAGGGSLDNTRGAYVRLGGNESSLVGDAIISAGDVGGANLILSAPNNKVLIQTGGATKWSVDNTGLLLSHLSDGRIVANTTDSSDNAQLHIAGGGNTGQSRGGGFVCYGNEHVSTPGRALVYCGNVTNSYIQLQTYGSQPIYFATNDIIRWSIDSAGNLVPATNDAYNIGTSSYRASTIYLVNSPDVSSDMRLKTDVTSIDSGLALQKVCNLNPIEYKFIPSFESSGLLKSGFKAQEIVNEIPIAVTQGDSDLTKQLGDEGFEMWSLKSEQIIPYLVAAIQKLKEEQDLLNQKLNN